MFGLLARPWDISRNISCLCLTKSRKDHIFHAWVKTLHAGLVTYFHQAKIGKSISHTYSSIPDIAVCVTIPTLLLFRVLDILLLRKLKVRITRYFSDSTFAGTLYLSDSSSSILKVKKMSLAIVTVQFCVYPTNISLVLAEHVTSCLILF